MRRLTRGQVVGSVLVAAAVTAVATSLYLGGTPSAERARRLDQRRVRDLRGLADAVDVYWTRHAALPPTLSGLASDLGDDLAVADPVTGEPYGYDVLRPPAYELCATFEGTSAATREGGSAGFWSHGVGRHCFRREAESVR